MIQQVWREISLFCSYDVVLTAGKQDILEKFKKFNARVVFSAEGFCWPDPSLSVGFMKIWSSQKTTTKNPKKKKTWKLWNWLIKQLADMGGESNVHQVY